MTSTELVSRQADQPSSAPSLAALGHVTGIGGHLPEVMQVCNAIAAAGEMVPRAYQGKPGAVLLAKMWADNHGIDLFTAIQHISPIEGKPYVSAEMRVALATQAGFEFRITESTAEVCTIEIWYTARQAYEKRGEVTCRFDDRTRKMTTSKGHPTPWALHPDDMLFAEACRKADRRYVKTAAALLDGAQDYDDQDTVVDVLDTIHGDQNGAQEPQAEPVDTDGAPAPEEPAPAQDEPQATDWDPIGAEADIRALAKATGKTVSNVLKEAQRRWPDAEPALATIEAIASDPDKTPAIKAWLAGE